MAGIYRLLKVKSLWWTALGYGENCDLSFLKDYPPLEALQISAIRLKSVAGLEHQRFIRELDLQTYAKGKVDWRVFERLESVVCESHLFTGTAWDCVQLRELFLVSCRESGWSNLNRLCNLKELELSGSTIETLGGLELTGLTKLGLYHANKLTDLQGVERLQHLRTLSLDSCKRLHSLSPITGLKELQELNIIDCGHTQTIACCRSLQALERLRFYGSVVSDGKIRCVLDLPNLRELSFDNRKEYDVTAEEVSAILEERWRSVR